MADRAYDTIRWAQDGPLGVLTLNRPDARNGITGFMMQELHELLQAKGADPSVRVLVLRGEGRDFCPGADLKAYAAGQGGVTPLESFNVAVLLHEMPAVTIAAIRGACAGAGLGWAAACDLRIASDTARFNTAFLGVGLSGDMGGPWTLTRILGAAKARELYFLPEKFDAAEAQRIGLLTRLVPDDRFEAEVDAFAARLAAKAPLTLRTLKENFVAAERMSFAEFVPFEAERHSAMGQTRDAREARTAFLEKRPPVFEAR